MSVEGEYRRMLPPPGRARRPGLLTVLVRWRAELLLIGLVAGLWRVGGPITVAIIGAVAVLAVVVFPTVRHGLTGATRTLVTWHRVRVGIAQSGIHDRSGRLPWLPWARPVGSKGVTVGVWLRAGTTAGDLRGATEVIAAACGATAVEVEQHGPRNDRVQLHVVRPRWGWFGR